MTNMVNKRKHPRIDTNLKSETKPARRTMFEAKVVNFSEGGAFVETGEKLLHGSEVILCLTLEIKGKNKACMFQGTVAWSNNDRTKGALGFGIAFHHMSKSMAQTVQGFLEQHAGKAVDGFGAAEKPKEKKKPSRGQLRG